ncbi:MAG: CHASE2 domain-containing protein [Methylococcaceae bacterium]|nr:CHASE2 domain-containing protein [Methylococcaceae bacterium]
MKHNQNKYSAIIITTVIIVFLVAANFLSIFKSSNAQLNDVLMRYSFNTTVSEKLIVIEANKRYSLKGDEVWIPFLKTLLAEEVTQIVFNFLPEQVSKKFYQLAASSNKVVFARRFIRKNSSSNERTLQPLPLAAVELPLNMGLIQEIENQHGAYRSQHTQIKFDNNIFPSLELITAQRVLNDKRNFPKTDYYIDFSGGLASLPAIDIERVLAAGLVSELVSGRTVFVGVHDLEAVNRYFTPISTEEGLISAVFFHAFALDTLLSEHLLTTISKTISWLLIILITVGSLFVFQRMTFQFAWFFSVFLSLLYVFMDWLLLHQFFLLIPLTELLLAQWLTFTLVWRYRMVQEKRFLDTMLFDLSFKLQEKIFPVSFYKSESPWEQLIVMLNQTLDFKRLIFLERVQGDHRLKEISAFNCKLDDIDELRRDYERTPYSTAINENRAILLENPYFKKTHANEHEYLAPLIFAGEVLGFWAFTIDASNLHAEIKFRELINAYVQQISEILHYRNEWKKRLKAEENKFLSYLRVEGSEAPYEMINKSITLMDRRMSELQEVFNTVTGSSVLYDLFGRVLLVNKRMEAFGQLVNIRPYNLTMLDFIVSITQLPPLKVQNLLQQTIFDRKTVTFPVSCFDDEASYILNIKPLKADDKQNAETIEDRAKVFQMIGILCELIDVTKMRKMSALREQMFERFSFQMRNDMASILFALPLLETEGVDEKDKTFALDNIKGKVDETLQTLEVVTKEMNKKIHLLVDDTLECYPIDAKFSLNQIVKKHATGIQAKNINLHYQLPQLISLVFASPTELENILSLLYLEIIADTYQAGELWLSVEEKEDKINFRFKNTGIGMPDDKLQGIMNNKINDSESVETLELQHAIHCVNQWGGSLNLSSQVSEGSTIELTLRRFM